MVITSTKLPGCRVNKHLFMDSGQTPGSHANNIYAPGSDKLTEVQLYKPFSCQSGSRVIVEILFIFSDLAVKATKLENKKKGFRTSEKARITMQPCKYVLLTRALGGE